MGLTRDRRCAQGAAEHQHLGEGRGAAAAGTPWVPETWLDAGVLLCVRLQHHRSLPAAVRSIPSVGSIQPARERLQSSNPSQ